MLKKYLTDTYTHNELADVSNHSCQGGFGDFIQYTDTVRHFERFKDDCFTVLNAYFDEIGEYPQSVLSNMGDYTQFANAMIWLAVEWYAHEITQGEYK